MPDSFKNYMKELSKTAHDTTDVEEDEVETEPSDEDEYQSNCLCSAGMSLAQSSVDGKETL